MKCYTYISRFLGVLAGAFFLIGAVIDYNITWTQSALLALYGVLLVLPWRRIRNNTLWWTLFIMLSAFTVIIVALTEMASPQFSSKRVTNICWEIILVAQLPAIWMIRIAARTMGSRVPSTRQVIF